MRLIVLGNPAAGDDGAALAAAALVREPAERIEAGRPGAGLLDLLAVATPVVLADVTRGLGAPGRITRATLEDLADRLDERPQVSSHGFGPTEALRLALVLGRPLPPLVLVGLEGRAYDPGAGLSPEIERALPAFAAALDGALSTLRRSSRARPGPRDGSEVPRA